MKQKYTYTSGVGAPPMPAGWQLDCDESPPSSGTARAMVEQMSCGEIGWFYFERPSNGDYGHARQMVYNHASQMGVSIVAYFDDDDRLIFKRNGKS